jgi:uncharacterized repeat protein (TIGR03803 family)
MNNPTQHRSWILRIHRRAAVAGLALAIMLVPAVFATRSAQAQTYAYDVLYRFTDSSDGGFPWAGLALDAQGNLYGTTNTGGTFARYGTVFKVDTTGKETVLYSFTGGGDGANPSARLVLDAQGNLYGTTTGGGEYGCGTVFKVDTSGKETVLYSFGSTGEDGANPGAVLVLDAQGNLYSTTFYGGADNEGTVFKLDTSGNETVLYSLGSTEGDGANPNAGLVLDAQGNLYGTTTGGGAGKEGTVFMLDTSGKETVLHSFTGTGGDGAYPEESGLVLDAQGNLYGTTTVGGAGNEGTVFKLDTSGNETVLYSFGLSKNGRNPIAGVVLDAQGNLYGTTYYGGTYGKGTVFRVDTSGKETVLHSFSGRNGDGAEPLAGVVLDAQGNLYGTTLDGGDPACNEGYGCGTVFELLTPAAATTTTLASAPNPSTYGEAVTFTAVVSGGAGAPPDGESVTFKHGTTVLGTGALSGGSASLTTSALPVGGSAIKAVYGGDVLFSGSTSNTVKQVVKKVTTATTLTSSPNPSTYGQAVTFTAVVTSSLGAPPDGESVTFKEGTTVLGTGSLSGGSASFTTSALPVGTNAIKAVYGGDIHFAASTSNTVKQVVKN